MLFFKQVKEYWLMKSTGNVWVLAVMVVLAGCGGSSGTMMDDDAAMEGADYGDDAQSSGLGDDAFAEGDAFGADQAGSGMLENRVIYFAFDKADIDPKSKVMRMSVAVVNIISAWVKGVRRPCDRYYCCRVQAHLN
jgi:hypothetical protein